jgi:hypothetical protein
MQRLSGGVGIFEYGVNDFCAEKLLGDGDIEKSLMIVFQSCQCLGAPGLLVKIGHDAGDFADPGIQVKILIVTFVPEIVPGRKSQRL